LAYPFLNTLAAETEFLPDRGGRLAGIIQQPNLFKPRLPEAMQTRPCILVFHCDRMSRTKWALETAQLLLDHLAQVLDQMEAVSDLPRLWGTDPCSFRVEALAISTDDLDGRARA
jgi:hypothetical protein